MLDLVHLCLDVEERLEGARRFLEHAASRVRQAVLRQVANRQAGGLDDAAGVGFVEPGQHFEQGRLAGAIRPAETDTLSVADLPRDVIEQGAVAERFGEISELYHCRIRADLKVRLYDRSSVSNVGADLQVRLGP